MSATIATPSTTLTPSTEIQDAPVGIGGWLLLPAFSLVVSPILWIVSLATVIPLWDDVSRAGFGEVLALGLMMETCLVGYQICALTRFFAKRENAPATMIGLFTANIVGSILMVLVSLGADAEPFAVSYGQALLQSVIGAAIWIPYFQTSKRVAATFTKPVRG